MSLKKYEEMIIFFEKLRVSTENLLSHTPEISMVNSIGSTFIGDIKSLDGIIPNPDSIVFDQVNEDYHNLVHFTVDLKSKLGPIVDRYEISMRTAMICLKNKTVLIIYPNDCLVIIETSCEMVQKSDIYFYITRDIII